MTIIKYMRIVVIICILTTILIACDQLNSAYLKNKSGKPISTSLYFFSYNPSDTSSRQNTYIKYLMEDSLIKNNAKLTLLRNKTARVDFLLEDNSELRLIFDTAPLNKGTVDFDAIKIVSYNKKLELFEKEKILDSFKPETYKTMRFLTISK